VIDYQTSYRELRFAPEVDRNVAYQEIIRFLRPYLAAVDRAADLFAGGCQFINNLPAPVRFAVDLDDTIGQHAAPGVTAIEADCRERIDAIADGSLDLVFISNGLEHVTRGDAARVCAEVRRMLRPGGRFIVLQPNFRLCWKHYFDDFTHVTIFTDVGLRMFLQHCGFQVERMIPAFMPFSAGQVQPRLAQSRWLIRAYLHSPLKPRAGQMLAVAQRPQEGQKA
jgi:SAM-dependent methyltransferase